MSYSFSEGLSKTSLNILDLRCKPVPKFSKFIDSCVGWLVVVYFWGFYDIKFKLTQYKSKLGLIPQYTFDLREFEVTNLKFGSNTTIYLAQHVTLTHYKPKPGLIPQHTKQTSLY